MTAWFVALYRGERSFPGRYVVIAYVALLVTPESSPLMHVAAALLGVSIALFLYRMPPWAIRLGNRAFGADPEPERVVIEARHKEIDR